MTPLSPPATRTGEVLTALAKTLPKWVADRLGRCPRCGKEYQKTWLTNPISESKPDVYRVYIHEDSSGVTEDWCLGQADGEHDD